MKKKPTIMSMEFCVMAMLNSWHLCGAAPTNSPNVPQYALEELPLTREAALSAALRQVAILDGRISSASSVGNPMQSYWIECPGDTEIVSELIREQEPEITVSNPADPVYYQIYLRATDNQTLFYGQTTGKLEEQEDGDWEFPASSYYLDLQLWHEIKIDVPFAFNAKVTLRDENDRITGEYFPEIVGNFGQSHQKMFFPSWLLGKIGELTLQFYREGEETAWTQVYDLSTGKNKELINGKMRAHTFFRDVLRIEDPDGDEGFYLEIKSYNGYGVSPLIEAVISEEGFYRIGAETTEGATPERVVIRDMETGVVNQVILKGPDGRPKDLEVLFDVGRYHIYYLWNPEDFQSQSGALG